MNFLINFSFINSVTSPSWLRLATSGVVTTGRRQVEEMIMTLIWSVVILHNTRPTGTKSWKCQTRTSTFTSSFIDWDSFSQNSRKYKTKLVPVLSGLCHFQFIEIQEFWIARIKRASSVSLINIYIKYLSSVMLTLFNTKVISEFWMTLHISL